jgi:hypothetical protein
MQFPLIKKRKWKMFFLLVQSFLKKKLGVRCLVEIPAMCALLEFKEVPLHNHHID